MFNKNAIVATILLLLVAATTSLAQSPDKYQWKLEDTENGCQIYISPSPGKDYIAAKTTCTVPARIDVVGVVIRDIANYPAWMFDCKETKILKIVDDDKDVFILWYRQHITLMTDRDMVLKSETQVREQGDSISVYIKADLTKEMNYDADEGYVRMPSFSSEYALEWIDKDHSRVTFMVDPDLGRGIPSGVANRIIKKNPFKSIQGLIKMVKTQKYIDMAKTSKYAKMVDDAIKDGILK